MNMTTNSKQTHIKESQVSKTTQKKLKGLKNNFPFPSLITCNP